MYYNLTIIADDQMIARIEAMRRRNGHADFNETVVAALAVYDALSLDTKPNEINPKKVTKKRTKLRLVWSNTHKAS